MRSRGRLSCRLLCVSVLIVGGKFASKRFPRGGLPIFHRNKEGRSWKTPVWLMAWRERN